jgi:hypothetical protein
MNIKYEVGDNVALVEPVKNKDFSSGVVSGVMGLRWLRVTWPCGVIFQEHVNDLRKL